MMVKVFRLTDYSLLSLVVEWPGPPFIGEPTFIQKSPGHRATELVDLVELGGDRILSYTEFFVPR